MILCCRVFIKYFVPKYEACFIPFALVPLLLGKGLSPIQALNIIHLYLDTLNLALTCTPLLDTLQAAGTDPTIADGGVHLFATPSTPFRGEPGLTLYMKNQVLSRDLPGLKHPFHPGQQPAPGQPAGQPPAPGIDPTLAATLTALANQQLKLSEGLDQRRPPATIKNTWGPLYTQRLLLLCRKLEEANLPPIYQAWAQKGKHEKTHMIFQSQVATCAAEFHIQAPLVTTAALKKFQDGNFHGTDPFDVADGILPLAFTPPGGSAASLKREQEAAATVAAYDTMISTEGNSLTLKDSFELQKTKAYLPINWTEATTQLESYLAVLATILGMHHPVVQGYQNGLAKLKLQQMPLCRAIADELGELITPSIVVYYFQIQVRQWLEEQWGSTFTVPSPGFGKDFQAFRITQNLHWLPNVTNVAALRHLRRAAAAAAPAASPTPPAAGPTKPGKTTPGSNQGSSGGGPGAAGVANKVKHSQLREVIAAMRDKGTNPLSRPDGRDRCHAWHLRGNCFSNCKNIHDHGAIAGSEQDQVWTWCQEAYGV
eukprot:jgi/Psemu1/33153/gm1.33153_g